eukprot:g5594.t1
MSLSMFSLVGKVAVITGGGSGIGLGIAKGLSNAGANVVLVGRREKVLQDAVREIDNERDSSNSAATTTTTTTGEAKFVSCDVSVIENLPSVAQEMNDAFGRVDILVNCAGVNLREPPENVTPESWDFTVRLNLSCPFFLAREFVPQMQERKWGKIINIASLQTQRAFPNGAAYGATKGGISQLTRAMAEAWSQYNITANAIAPGFVKTELTEAVFSDKERSERNAAQTCIGRNSVVTDLQGAAIFFASKSSDYVTGQTLFVDGGYTAK